eukprot:COSAG06_NODE_6185_length_3060_cov_8.926242_1_plen_68_part_00
MSIILTVTLWNVCTSVHVYSTTVLYRTYDEDLLLRISYWDTVTFWGHIGILLYIRRVLVRQCTFIFL